MIQRKRLAIVALVTAIALIGVGTGAYAGTEAQIDRGSGITVADHADALIAIEDNTITNHFPMDVDVTVTDGEEHYTETLGSGDTTGTIEVNETTDVVVTVTGEATTAKIEGVEFEGTQSPPSKQGVVKKWQNINKPLKFNTDVNASTVMVNDEWPLSNNGKVQFQEPADLGCDSSSDEIDATITGETETGQEFTEDVTGVNCNNNGNGNS